MLAQTLLEFGSLDEDQAGILTDALVRSGVTVRKRGWPPEVDDVVHVSIDDNLYLEAVVTNVSLPIVKVHGIVFCYDPAISTPPPRSEIIDEATFKRILGEETQWSEYTLLEHPQSRNRPASLLALPEAIEL